MANSFDDIHYDAFISYRHNPKDEFVAKNLQEMLETYVVPDNAKDKVKKARISRIFRDKDELPLSDNLGSSIEKALNNTDYLIVICSPSYRESKWCMKEIETFISLHGYGKIILVLCDGTTSTSFPPQLLSADVEPFASDVRGATNKEIMSKLKVEYIRVAATILEVPYDVLRQREQERVLRRKAKAMRNAAIVTGVVAALSITALTKITLQKKQLITNSVVSLLKEADDEYRIGNICKSNEDIIAASDYDMKNGGKFDGAILNKLARNLGVYDTDIEYKSTDTYKMGSEIVNVKISNDGKHILLVDKTGSIRVISCDEFGREDFAINNARSGVSDSLSAGFLDDNTIYYIGEKDKLMLGYLNLDKDTQALAQLFTQKNRKVTVSPDKKYLAIAVDTAVEIYDTESLEMVYSDQLKPDEYTVTPFNSYITFLDDEKVLYSISDAKTDTQYENESTENEIVTIYDFAKDEYRAYTTGICKTVYAKLIDGRLYLCYMMLAKENDIPTVRLSCIDYGNNLPLWNADFNDLKIDDVHRTESGKLLVAGESVIMNLDSENGKLIDIYNIEAAHALSFENCPDGTVRVLTSKGLEIILKIMNDGIVIWDKKELMDTASLKTVVQNNDILYGVPEGNTSLINKYELSKLPPSQPYEGRTTDLQYSDAVPYAYEPGEAVAVYGTPYARLHLPNQDYNIYSFENGRVLTVEKFDKAIIDEAILDCKIEVEAGTDAYGNSYFAEKSDESHYGDAIAVSKDGQIISVFKNFAGISEDGHQIILSTQVLQSKERELRAYPIYSYKELVDMATTLK